MDKKQLEEILAVAVAAAKAAGALVVAKQKAPLELRSKGFRDVVTDADYASQALISRLILEQFPADIIVGEEDDADEQASRNPSTTAAAITWYIDPIDGTSNFSRGLPLFNVSIGAAQLGEMQVGVVYDPLRDEMFTAIKGHGAWLNGQPLRVSDMQTLSDSMVCHDWSRSAESRQTVLNVLDQLSQQARTIRAIGSAALVISWIAAGRLDGYFNLGLSAWDIAAAGLILSEAGGTTTGENQQPFAITDASSWTLSTNSHIHAEFLDIFSK